MKRKEILESAIQTVCADRQDQYGEPENTFTDIAKLMKWWLMGYADKPIEGQIGMEL